MMKFLEILFHYIQNKHIHTDSHEEETKQIVKLSRFFCQNLINEFKTNTFYK